MYVLIERQSAGTTSDPAAHIPTQRLLTISPVEIGHPGSNVFVNQQQWDTATAQNSYTTMGISLVRALFEEDVLLASNLRGSSSRSDTNAARRPGLNSVILAVIEG
ncbi:Protein of unknown function [Cotesia congregata]|uniref:Uncharacterized protein n=1 Tax=Cotesia congregata TaxID=51543 RepID=A0A8J2HEQ8_COTCN|nr:Protein of unknown function [Cotesia congregata]